MTSPEMPELKPIYINDPELVTLAHELLDAYLLKADCDESPALVSRAETIIAKARSAS